MLAAMSFIINKQTGKPDTGKRRFSIASGNAEWAREQQIAKLFGLSHAILYPLRKERKIRTVSMCGEGKSCGMRPFHVHSIRDYIASLGSKEVGQ